MAEAIARQPEPVPTSTARGDSSSLVDVEELDDHELRLGPGDQDGGRDLEGQGVELLPPDQVGDGRALGAAADQVAKPAARALRHLLLEVGVELDALPVEDVGQHDLRVEPGTLRAPSLEVIGRPGQEPPDGPRAPGPHSDLGVIARAVASGSRLRGRSGTSSHRTHVS